MKQNIDIDVWVSHVTHFLLGMIVDCPKEKEQNNIFKKTKGKCMSGGDSKVLIEPIVKVGSGINQQNLQKIRDKLKDNLIMNPHNSNRTKKISSIPDYFNFNKFEAKDFPDVVVKDPLKSVVLTIRAAQIINANNMGCPYTLRFPRCEKVRFDKPILDCMSTTEFLKLKE